jgi:hypothetical protein
MSKWIGPLVGLGILAAVVVFWNPTICSQVENLVGKAVPFCGANYHSSSNPIDFITHSLGGPGTAQHQQRLYILLTKDMLSIKLILAVQPSLLSMSIPFQLEHQKLTWSN